MARSISLGVIGGGTLIADDEVEFDRGPPLESEAVNEPVVR